MVRWIPAITIQAMLDAFRVLGLDERRLRADANVSEELLDRRGLVPDLVRERLWASAYREAQRDELAVEAGLALPFGALGPMDYLAASAETLGSGCEALAQYFGSLSSERSLELEQGTNEYRIKLVVSDAREDALTADEFTLAVMVGRFRARADGFSVSGVQLRRPPPKRAERFSELFSAPVSFGHAVATLCLPARMRDVPLSTSDPWLRRALESLLPQREARAHGASPLERSLRDCLRELLPQGRLGAARVAGALGMSERSLHRRLRELGQSYQVVVAVFRREEAERLLVDGRVDMTEIAHRLGFADQSAFSRAFRRWTRMAPRSWLARQSAPVAEHGAPILAAIDK